MQDSKTALIIGCDHAAFSLKEKLKNFLISKSISVHDAGTSSENSVNYPEFGIKVASCVSSKKFEKGVLLCGTGIGMSMVANRFPHVRAALCADVFSAIMSRQHNDSNILVMGARVIGDILAEAILNAWLNTSFEGGRHQLRLDQFDNINNLT